MSNERESEKSSGREDNPSRGEEEAKMLDGAAHVALDGLVELLAGIHRKKERERDRGERPAGTSGGALRFAIEGNETASDLLFSFAKLQVNLAKEVLTFHRKHRDSLLDRLRGRDGRGEGRAPTGGSALIVPGTRRGAYAKDASPETIKKEGTRVSFVVENQSAKKVNVLFRLSELRSRDGNPPLRAQSMFDVAEPFVVDRDAERSVDLYLLIDSRFKAGTRYRGSVEISMPGLAKQQLPLRVDVEAETAAPTPVSPPSGSDLVAAPQDPGNGPPPGVR
jgi:hypothetical protein